SQKASLFESFRQLQRGQGGVGLGLVIVQRILEGMGTTLCVQSSLGRGSIFSFELDVKQLGERAIPPGVIQDESSVDLPSPGEDTTVPPEHVRQHLASLARSGRLSDIEEWLSINTQSV